MQNRYAGDIGDYVKLALLRAVSEGRRVGVAWWLCPDGGPAGDGRHVAYLDAPATWRHLDASLFDALQHIVSSNQRSVATLEQLQLLPDAVYCSDTIPTGMTPAECRSTRLTWFARCRAVLQECDLVFLDPDNGLEPSKFSTGSKRAAKAVSMAELCALREPGRALIVYHHQTRRPGGHLAELDHWGDRLRKVGFARVGALRATAYSVRAFFLLDADDALQDHARQFAHRWRGRVSWHEALG